MNILLDTYVAIWSLLDSPKLTEKAKALILDPDNTIYYSSVSVWEVLLKRSAHPDNMALTPELFAECCRDAGFVPLEIIEKHILTVGTFPDEVAGHKDPFDRLLLAQAKSENMSFLTNDSKIPLYKEKCVVTQ